MAYQHPSGLASLLYRVVDFRGEPGPYRRCSALERYAGRLVHDAEQLPFALWRANEGELETARDEFGMRVGIAELTAGVVERLIYNQLEEALRLR
ncbi:MAG: hypothetical protein ACMXYM_02015 [Candidatus Woesearchaeota archaeon]